jgi:hypothetical protein
MRVNTEIIEEYLVRGHLEDLKHHGIFELLQAGSQSSATRTKDREKVRELAARATGRLNNFRPLNHELWLKIFGPGRIPDTVTIYLIVGAPSGYEAVVRFDERGRRLIILDLDQICTYSEDMQQLEYIVADYLTHELAHVMTGRNYAYRDGMTKAQLLKQLAFDEGIAHFLSYEEGVLNLDWEQPLMKERRRQVYVRFNEFFWQPEEIDFAQLKLANTGSFWQKFASISGMFALIQFYQGGGRLENLMSYGPDLLTEYIIGYEIVAVS